MRILHVIPDLAPATGGPVTAALGLAEAQAAAGHYVAIAASDYGLNKAPEAKGVTVHLFPCRYKPWRWSPELGRFLEQEVAGYDIVLIESLWQYPSLSAGRACRAAGIPYLVSPNGMLDMWSLAQKAWKKKPYLRLVEGANLLGAAAIHLTSDGELVNSKLHGWRIPKVVIPLGLSETKYKALPSQTDFYQRFPELVGQRIILFLGRLHYKKQPDVAIKAFNEVCRNADGWRLVLAGDGEPVYVAGLKALAENLGIAERVLFTGLLQGRAVTEAYCAASVFVLPSWQENFGLSAVEAMAAGCPVIVSNRMDLATEIAEAEAGLVVEPNVEDTANALNHLLTKETLRREMGSAGQRLVKENFTWDKSARAFTEIFEDILSGRRRSPSWR